MALKSVLVDMKGKQMKKRQYGLKEKVAAIVIIFLSHILISCTDYAIDGCSKDDPPFVENFWKGPGQTDVTFIAFGDPQFGGGPKNKNQLHIRAINVAEEQLVWNMAYFGIDEPVAKIRGVVIAGDLTQNGSDGRSGSTNEYGDFTSCYGLCGNRELIFPVFEGYGNHDYFIRSNIAYRIPEAHPVADSVSIRNDYRAGIINMAPGKDGHYSWEWDNVHFVMLNLTPSDIDPQHDVPGAHNPRMALDFLKKDLTDYVLNTSKKVVIITHYGFTSWDFDFWWTEEEADDFYDAIEEYDVVAYIHGHNHDTSKYSWKGISVYNVGSPYYENDSVYTVGSAYYESDNADGKGHFTLFRITDDHLYVGDVGWDPLDPEGSVEFTGQWYDSINL